MSFAFLVPTQTLSIHKRTYSGLANHSLQSCPGAQIRHMQLASYFAHMLCTSSSYSQPARVT